MRRSRGVDVESVAVSAGVYSDSDCVAQTIKHTIRKIYGHGDRYLLSIGEDTGVGVKPVERLPVLCRTSAPTMDVRPAICS